MDFFRSLLTAPGAQYHRMTTRAGQQENRRGGAVSARKIFLIKDALFRCLMPSAMSLSHVMLDLLHGSFRDRPL